MSFKMYAIKRVIPNIITKVEQNQNNTKCCFMNKISKNCAQDYVLCNMDISFLSRFNYHECFY